MRKPLYCSTPHNDSGTKFTSSCTSWTKLLTTDKPILIVLWKKNSPLTLGSHGQDVINPS
uniref:Uncharacterized protein n=1 Tax=Rhizophora mucronata TaxID=61149 RepID=A0A2P2QDV5_RHIMU